MIEILTQVITVVFLLSLLSYYVLLVIPKKQHEREKKTSSLSIIIPAHNEEKTIIECLESVLVALQYKEKKHASKPNNTKKHSLRYFSRAEIIIVDDGSVDSTSNRVRKWQKNLSNKGNDNLKWCQVILLKQDHGGKSAAINRALQKASGELITVVDADSFVDREAFFELAETVRHKGVSAATGVVRVHNRKQFPAMWFQLEQVYNSLMRAILAKINANIVTPGPINMYKRKDLLAVGGFSTKGFSEDMDIAIRLIRGDKRIEFCGKAVSSTILPVTIKGIWRQRSRWARGAVDIIKRHLRLNNTIIDIYTLPLLVFQYFQAVIMSVVTLVQMFSGYYQYFVSQGTYFSGRVMIFFFEWLSIVGFVRWVGRVFIGESPFSLFVALSIFASLLSYPLFFVALLRFEKKVTFLDLVAFLFLPAFWLGIMIIYASSLPEFFRKNQFNKWKKNEP